MAYRTYINGQEWLGNNEMYEEIYQELIRQGCPFDEDRCVIEPFEVKDLDGLVRACEKVIIKLVQRDKEIANFKPNIDKAIALNDLTYSLKELQDCAYIFMSVNLLKYIGDVHNQYEFYWEETDSDIIMKYRLTDKGKCLFKAY